MHGLAAIAAAQRRGTANAAEARPPSMAFVSGSGAVTLRASRAFTGTSAACASRACSWTPRTAVSRRTSVHNAHGVSRGAIPRASADAQPGGIAPEDAPKGTVIVLGGDGFCGWPTALYLSELGHDVIVVDNMSRRKIDIDLEVSSLTPIRSMSERVHAWKESTGRIIRFVKMDVAQEYDRLLDLIVTEQPLSIVHFAEQRSAPYSMKSGAEKRYTVDNNITGTNNLLVAVVESGVNVHVVHLGTMGVYGYGTSGGEIPEGYIDVILPGGRESRILHPSYPGSVYHTTKVIDQSLFQFFNKNDQLKITDLHQGIVWGTNTDQTLRDERLINRFDYCSDYGTVLNRFLMQAALGVPLTVYGTGGQTRAFIHIKDTARCIAIAIANPPADSAPVEIFNQIAETHRVRDLAGLISKNTGCEVKNIANPRKEAAENELEVANRKFRSLGLVPTLLEDGLLDEVVTIAEKYRDRCDKTKIMPSSFWNADRKQDCESDTVPESTKPSTVAA